MRRPASFILAVSTLCFSSCGHAQQQTVNSPFEYREVYLPELKSEEGHQLHLNSVDRDWGIWGHNLSVVLPKNPSPSVYAKQGNILIHDQFCFSSETLFEYIKDYINDNYGKDRTTRFAILPNDNSVVCKCGRCTELGNKDGDASGAVYHLLERLAEEFPRHIFFSSYYRTTSSLPRRRLPENAGVLISAMSFPLSPVHTSQEDRFAELLNRWSEFTDRIYIWDYLNNFDDYFTPFPIFDVAQRRLRLYEDSGVKGVFFNGSGMDYSSMHILKTRVLAAMLSDPYVEWRPLLKELCHEEYPVAGNLISEYMEKQEDMTAERGTLLPLYEGLPAALKTYLWADEFIRFHNALDSLLPTISEPEYSRVLKMDRALMLTHLEINRISADTTGCVRMLDQLEKLIDQGTTSYSESGGSIRDYVEDYRNMLKHAEKVGRKNLLKGVRLEPLTALDEEYRDISIITDGLLGLPSNYHCGQMLSSATPSLRIAVPNVKGMKSLCVNMTRNAIFHIAFPLRVSLSADGQVLGEKEPKASADNLQHASVEFDIPSNCKGTLVLTIFRNQEERTMAIDEIEGF
ncbi:MAG: DUF4838 domain-containing protein [Bacteroidaceae bacterium]|nr:DUF4838 domain-containing protein [Bacteroidaceae bacterium]